MRNLLYWLRDYRVMAAIAMAAAAALAMFGGDKLAMFGLWLAAAAVLGLLVWLAVWIVRRVRNRRAARQLDSMVQQQADHAVATAKPAARADVEVLRERMNDAVKAIKSSKLGLLKGAGALYELPWYVIIGNPAAGKSTAILNSGLRFPFEDNRSNVIHGLGGTRNCDWYFTTEGIVLDTAGRYTVSAEDRLEWLTFLDLLKKNRPRAPINGIIIAASIAELSGSKPEFAIDLAKNLRQRVQELTERLEVFAPVYVVFTKADLIGGFSEFFQGLDPSERENVWGATLPYALDKQGDPIGASDALGAFDGHFDELCDGLKEMSLAQMAMQRGREVAPGLLTLPMEFAGIKPALRTFIATLFEENPYQFKPVFRGFYFTSALQEGMSVQPASERVARQFGLSPRAAVGERSATSASSHFLLGLFRKVIFADKQLVRQYSSAARGKLRLGAFAAAVLVLGIALAGWTWSYTGNRQLVANVSADLDKAVSMQQNRVDLQSRIDALLLLQDWMERLDRQHRDHPLSMGLGLYQGDRIETKLRAEYFNGMRQLMLNPVNAKLEAYLTDVIAHRNDLRAAAIAGAPVAGAAAGNESATAQASDGLYQEASPTDAEDAYNALKTYLMLGDRSRAEASQLNDQLTRFWRGWLEANRGTMPREAMARSAERLMSYYVAQSTQPSWPQIDPKIALVDDSRQALRTVMKGTAAVDQVYAQIKARAATRFAAITVASLLDDAQGKSGVLAGSYQVSGTFSRAAWEDYIKDAIKEAANKQLSSNDWVLDATVQSDLTLAGSPEHIAKELTALYKADYAREWRKFLQGVSVAEFGTFDRAVATMNNLGDPTNSPLRKLLEAVNRQTVWDNPVASNKMLGAAKKGFMAWFERAIMRRNPTSIPVTINPDTGKPVPVAMGPIGKEFEGLARLLAVRDGGKPLLDGYFDMLGKLRTRLNTIKTQGDPGPGARKLMQDTLDGSAELADAQRLVDEQMLNGLTETQRDALRPLLMRPLVQSFAALVRPAEGEINRTWSAQVYEPFQGGIAQKYPFAADASVEAAQADIDQIFGPNGAIAKFSADALGTLVIRRGNAITPQRWADIGINLRPELMSSYASWVSPSGQAGASSYVFEVMPMPAVGTISEYTLTIDGQQLRYRNEPPRWTTFTWPNPQGTPGAHITALGADGRTVEVVNIPGNSALNRLLESAQRQQLGQNHYQLSWSNGDAAVTVQLRIVSMPSSASASGSSMRGLKLPEVVAGATPAASPPAVAAPTVAAPAAVAAPIGAP